MHDYLSILRCPGCGSSNLELETAPGASPNGGADSLAQPNPPRRIVCGACGHAIELRDGILHALPAEMDRRSAANRGHYDAMAQGAGGDLDRRTHTRNHARKLKAILDALHLTSGMPGAADGGPAGKARPARRVIEFGAGLCAHGQVLKRLGHEYVALDISPGNLARARTLYPAFEEGDLCAADAMNAPFRDGAFDAGYYVGALHHVPRPEQGVRELIRVLRSGGRFCFLEPRRFYPVHFIHCLLKARTEVSALKMKASRLKRWLRDAGASEIQLSHCVFTPNRPAALVPLYESVDTFMEAHPALQWASVMFCVQGRK